MAKKKLSKEMVDEIVRAVRQLEGIEFDSGHPEPLSQPKNVVWEISYKTT